MMEMAGKKFAFAIFKFSQFVVHEKYFSVYLLNISTFQHFELMELNVSAQLKASHSLLTLVLILKW